MPSIILGPPSRAQFAIHQKISERSYGRWYVPRRDVWRKMYDPFVLRRTGLGLNIGHPEILQESSGKPLDFATAEDTITLPLAVDSTLPELDDSFRTRRFRYSW